MAGRSTARLVTFLALLWMTGGLLTLRFALAMRPEERFGRRWTLGAVVLGSLELALGAVLLLTSEADAGRLASIVAAWGVVSGSLLIAEGLKLHRFARDWQGSAASPEGP